MILFKGDNIIIQKGNITLVGYEYTDIKKVKFAKAHKSENTFTVWLAGKKKYVFDPDFNWGDLIAYIQDKNEKVLVETYNPLEDN